MYHENKPPDKSSAYHVLVLCLYGVYLVQVLCNTCVYIVPLDINLSTKYCP